MVTYTAIEGTSSGLATFNVNINTQMQSKARYIVEGGASINLTLPAVCTVGDEIWIDGDSTFGFVVVQNALQSITALGGTTIIGVGGSITSSDQGDSIKLICKADNYEWFCEVNNGPNLVFV